MEKEIETKFGTAKLDKDGYYRVLEKMLHRLIWEDWYNKPIPNGCIIHHLNHNKKDNRIQNLQCVTDKSHKRYHSKNPTEKQKQVWLNYIKQPKSKEHKEKLSIARNNVGYLNVSRHYSEKYKKGYTWRYSYSENGKRYDIQRVKLGDLEKEVKRRNLKWKRIDNGGDLNIV